MGGSLEAFKLFTASEKRRQERAEQLQAQAQTEKKNGTNIAIVEKDAPIGKVEAVSGLAKDELGSSAAVQA